MNHVASNREHPAYPIGVVMCGDEPKLVIGESLGLKLLSKHGVTAISLPETSDWSTVAVSSDGRTFVAGTEVSFSKGILYQARQVNLC